MTVPSEPTPPMEGQLNRWLQNQRRQLINELRGVLDLDAGLRDIGVDQQHVVFENELHGVLDLDAGLRDILQGTRPSPSAAKRTVNPPPRPASPIAGLLAARTDPAVRAGLEALKYVRTAWNGRNPARVLARTLARILDRSGSVHTRDRSRALNRDLDLVRALTGDLDNALALARGRDLPRGRSHVHDLDYIRDRALALNRDLKRDLSRAFVLALDLARDLDRTLPRDLARDLDRARDLARDLDRALPRDRALARDLALDRDLTGDLTGDLAGKIADVLVRVIDRILTQALTRNIPGLDLDNLTPQEIGGLLDDFTKADLRNVDLVGVDLIGVRWSRSTCWPPSVSIDDLRARSRETERGSGIFEIIEMGGISHRVIQT